MQEINCSNKRRASDAFYFYNSHCMQIMNFNVNCHCAVLCAIAFDSFVIWSTDPGVLPMCTSVHYFCFWIHSSMARRREKSVPNWFNGAYTKYIILLALRTHMTCTPNTSHHTWRCVINGKYIIIIFIICIWSLFDSIFYATLGAI